MNEKAEPRTTNVLGYYNPNTYKVSINISELGISVELPPSMFILERGTDRKINDPILDRYVGKMLKPALSPTPVPVYAIKRPPPPTPSAHVVGQGVRDSAGKWQLAPAAPERLVAGPPINRASHTGMSIEEARKRGFIGKPRPVSEDYGAPETGGTPARGDNLPMIKYAMESQAPLARHGSLPSEYAQEIQPGAQAAISSLEQAAHTDAETVSLEQQDAERAVAEQQGEAGIQKFQQEIQRVQKFQQEIQRVKRMPSATLPPPPAPEGAKAVQGVAYQQTQTQQPDPLPVPEARRRIAKLIPQPPIPVAALPPSPPVSPPAQPLNEAEQESPLVGGPGNLPQAESPLVAGRPADLLVPAAPKDEDEEEPEEGKKKPNVVKCPLCGREFPYLSYYKRHVERKHPDKLSELFPA